MSRIFMPTDEELVIKVRKNKNLYAEIIRRYQNKLMRYIRFLVNDDNIAEDSVQNTFIKAYINLNDFNVNKKFSSWIYRIAHNEAINLAKKNSREIRLDNNFEAISGQDLEKDFIKKEIADRAHKCLGKMPVIYSEPLILYYIDNKSYEEISDILRIPVGTVGTRINRGKGVMKKICQTHEE